MILRLAVRSAWYSLSESVWLGATTMLSPVWTPIGSMFSMLQTVMQLSAPSRITSYSTSFQPSRAFSSSVWPMGLAATPPATISRSSCLGVGDAASGPAEGVGRPDDHGQADLGDGGDRFLDGADGDVGRQRLADVGHELAEQLAVLRAADGREGSAQQADVVSVEDSGVGQVDGEVEPGLSAQRRQYPVRALGLYDALQHGDGERLDVDDVRYVLVGHDGGGVRVDEHGRDALLAEGLARLRACVVELGGLPDDDRPGADDEDLGGAVGHHTISSRSVSEATSKSGW